MPRTSRIIYENAWYHIINRGAGKRVIFHNNNYRKHFLDLLNEINNRYYIEIHAYCLMDNHFHLLIRTPLTNLSHALQYLNGVYTQHYNQLKKTDGPLFRGRFKSILIQEDAYLLQLSRYIHLNPVDAKIVQHPENYPWSSYQAYLNPTLAPHWLSIDTILKKFGPHDPCLAYRRFVEKGVDKKTQKFFKKKKVLPIFGSENFTKTLSNKYLNESKNYYTKSEKNKLKLLPDTDTIIQLVADYYEISTDSIKYNVRRHYGNRPRAVSMYLATLYSGKSLCEISDSFKGITPSGISKAAKRIAIKIEQSKNLAHEVQTIHAELKKVMSNVRV